MGYITSKKIKSITSQNQVAGIYLPIDIGEVLGKDLNLKEIIDLAVNVRVVYTDNTTAIKDLIELLPTDSTQFNVSSSLGISGSFNLTTTLTDSNSWATECVGSTSLNISNDYVQLTFKYINQATGNVEETTTQIRLKGKMISSFDSISVGEVSALDTMNHNLFSCVCNLYGGGTITLSNSEFDMYVGGTKYEDDEYVFNNSVSVSLVAKGDLTNAYNTKSQSVNVSVSSTHVIFDGEIKSIELESELSLNVGNNSLLDIVNARVNVVYGADKTLKPTIANLVNQSMDISIDDNSFEDTSFDSENWDTLEDYKLSFVRTENYNNLAEITIEFSYEDSSDNTTKTFQFTIKARVNGFVRIVASPIDENVVSGTTLNGGMFVVSAYDGNNQSYILEESETNGFVLEDSGETLTNGVITKNITAVSETMVNNNGETIETSVSFNCYIATPSSIEVYKAKENYSVGQKFDYNDLVVYSIHYVDNETNVSVQTNEFTCNIANGYTFNSADIGEKSLVVSSTEGAGSIATSIVVLSNTTQEIWTFNKKTFQRTIYGEYEANFNLSLVLDGTKDSTKLIVYNNESEEIKPNTICYLPDIDTWFVVSQDTATRYADESSNGFWQHEIELVGAIDILVNRDLTNCGFNKGRYTLETLCNRLIRMTDFELPVSFDFEYFDKDKQIGYIKAFENYSPLSALRELFNGLNAICKMSFVMDNNYTITRAVIKPIPKSGISNEPIDIETFNEEEEVKSSSKGNYGTRVVSNIKNCVGSDIIRYPAEGGVMLTSDDAEITIDNNYLALPTNADYVDKLMIGSTSCIFIARLKSDNGGTIDQKKYYTHYGSFSEKTIMEFLDALVDEHEHSGDYDIAIQEIVDNKDEIIKKLMPYLYITIKNNQSLYFKNHLGGNQEFSFGDDLFYKTYEYKRHCIWWKQGTNKVNNVGGFMGWATNDGVVINENKFKSFEGGFYTHIESIEVYPLGKSSFYEEPLICAVEYKPQVSLKIKYENEEEGNDTSLFNQNGKLVDSHAVSKLIDSHAQEISSNNITRKKDYKSFYEIPKIGSIVKKVGNLKPYNELYYSVDYLDFNGDGYINVGSSENVKTISVSMAYKRLVGSQLFGHYNMGLGLTDSTHSWGRALSGWGANFNFDTEQHTYTYSKSATMASGSCEGLPMGGAPVSTAIADLYIGACNVSGNATYHNYCKVYGVSITKQDGTTINYKPMVRKSDFAFGLYDEVSGTFIAGVNCSKQSQLYIINNISLDFYENDDNGYLIKAEFGMTKQTACKSIMVSANNNIRDYDCPQNYNIERESLYRDYIEIDYTQNNVETPYFSHLYDNFDFGINKYGNDDTYTAYVKVRNSNYVQNLYYKIDTTMINLDKKKIVVADFQDNNIIGYAKAKTYQATFDLFKFFTIKKLLNVPISYVDSLGELKSIEMMLLNSTEYLNSQRNYLSNIQESDDKIKYFSYTPLIDGNLMYEYSKTNGNSLVVNEENYEKDGLEKPKFEFSMEIGNNNGIMVGNSFLKGETAGLYDSFIYQFVVSDNIITNENLPNCKGLSVSSAGVLGYYQACEITFNQVDKSIKIKLYDYLDKNVEGSIVRETPFSGTILGKNIAIVKRKVNRPLTAFGGYKYNGDTQELMFALNNCKVEVNQNNEIKLYINNYKLR